MRDRRPRAAPFRRQVLGPQVREVIVGVVEAEDGKSSTAWKMPETDTPVAEASCSVVVRFASGEALQLEVVAGVEEVNRFSRHGENSISDDRLLTETSEHSLGASSGA